MPSILAGQAVGMAEDMPAPRQRTWRQVFRRLGRRRESMTDSVRRVKLFNTTGPCRADRHYMLPPEPRLPDARRLIDEGKYFVVHAPRQTGKTTTLIVLAEQLTAEGR